MISNGNKKTERGADPAIAAGVMTEAQRIAAALARAETRIVGKLQTGPKIAANSPNAERAVPAQQAAPQQEESTPQQEESTPQQNPGFDPYNSGSFDRKHAWSKVGKR